MAAKKPLVQTTGKLRQIASGDVLEWNPANLQFVYAAGKLSTITNTETGLVKTFSYSGSRLTRIDEGTSGGIRLDFTYSGNDLTDISRSVIP